MSTQRRIYISRTQRASHNTAPYDVPCASKYFSRRGLRSSHVWSGRPSTSLIHATWSALSSPGNTGCEVRSSGRMQAALHRSISGPD
jgi:hypothetical protein